jgi:hypothetical protein
MLSHLEEIHATLENNEWLLTGARAPNSIALEEMLLPPAVLTSSVSPKIARWRSSLKTNALSSVPQAELHEIFHLFNCHELDGRWRNDETILLDRDGPDPQFFGPPAGISLAVDVTHQQSRAGRDDSSSTQAARKALAQLERKRRNQRQLTFENIALTASASQSLAALFSLLESEGLKGKIVVSVPNHPTLLCEIEQHFELERLALKKDYDWDVETLRGKLAEAETLGHLFTISYDAPRDAHFNEWLVSLSNFCAETNRYLIVLENGCAGEVSDGLDPIHFKQTITITDWSSAYHAEGLKISHLLADRKLIERLYRHAGDDLKRSSSPGLLCKTLASLELGKRANRPQRLPPELSETLSSSELLFKEFNLWYRVKEVHHQFTQLVMELIFKVRWFDSLKRVGQDTNALTDHHILSTHLKGSSYRTSLAVLAAKNVSVLPVDCLLPLEADRHDLRVTTKERPGALINGLTATCEELDNLYARQTEREWLHEDDQVWLERAGLFNLDPRLNFWGHTRRVKLRLEQVASALHLTPPAHVLRGATLHDLGKVWSLLGREEVGKEWARLTGARAGYYPWAEAQRDTVIAERLLRSTELSLPALPSELKDFLLSFFHSTAGETSPSHWLLLLDVADKTSDFKLTGEFVLKSLENCLQLKLMQVMQRYPQHRDSIKKEFDRTGASLRRLFSSLTPSSSPQEGKTEAPRNKKRSALKHRANN